MEQRPIMFTKSELQRVTPRSFRQDAFMLWAPVFY
jgi:hypothetical protein